MTALILAEHDNAKLSDATARTLSAALQIDRSVHILVAGSGCARVAEAAASLAGVEKVLLCDDAIYANALAEPVAELVLSLADRYGAILAPATANGKNILPRVAARRDVPQISDVILIESPEIFLRPIYAGNAIQKVEAKDVPKIFTVRTAAFKSAPAGGGAAPVEAIPPAPDPGLSRFESENLSQSARPELASARIIVSGGRGLGSKENFALIERIADRLGAGVGASRAAVDAGYVPNDYQVGQTGKVVAPELYIAIGISGAIQHLAGMKDSRIVVAINKDENAPIFSVADYGWVADLFEALPQLERALDQAGGGK
jgi:electron transfer flavoprotein alpha subunit